MIRVLNKSECDAATLRKVYDWLEDLIDHYEGQDTSMLNFMNGLEEAQTGIMQVLEED